MAPLTYPGFFEAHSGFLPAFNAAHLSDAPNWGRTSTVDPLRGEGKLPYLLAWPFLSMSGSGVRGHQVGLWPGFVLGALGVYAWTRRWLGDTGRRAGRRRLHLPALAPEHRLRARRLCRSLAVGLLALALWAIDRLAERRAAAHAGRGSSACWPWRPPLWTPARPGARLAPWCWSPTPW